MKLKTWISVYGQWMLTAVFAVAVFCFWLFGLPHLMLAREQSQLFLWNTEYLTDRLAVPGGLAQYLGEFIVQFMINPVYGACWYVVLFVGAQLLCKRLLSHNNPPLLRNKWYLLSFLLPGVLWYLACNPNIPMTPIVAVVLTLVLMNLLPKGRKARWITASVMAPVGYWLLGPAILLLVVYAFHWLPLLLLAGSVVGSLWITPYPSRQILRGIDYYWEGDKMGTYEEMKYDMLMRQQSWSEISKRYQERPIESLAIHNAAYLALWEEQRISQSELFSKVLLSNQSLSSVSSAFLTSEVAMQVGMVNIAQRSVFEAMEAIPNYNKSARALRRLVETNIITGQYEVALKYIAILEETTFYRGLARKMKPLAEHPEKIKVFPSYQRLKEAYDKGEDVFFY